MNTMNRFAELIEDWYYLLHRDGWRTSLPEVAHAIAILPVSKLKFIIVARSLSEHVLDHKPQIDIELHRFTDTDVGLVRQIDRPSEARLCARRLQEGHLGIMAMLQGEPAGYGWGCTMVNPDLEHVHLILGPKDFLSADAYTAPWFRGLGVQTALVLERFRLFNEMGFSRALTYIEYRNHPSLAVWRKLGCEEVGTVEFLRIGPWRRLKYYYPYASGNIKHTSTTLAERTRGR